MAYKNLREYLAELQRRDLLHIVEDEISKDTELVPLVRLQFRVIWNTSTHSCFTLLQIRDDSSNLFGGDFS